jgi:arylsulfatase B
LPAGKVYEKPVISLDVYATAAALAKAPIPKQRAIDGVYLLPHLLGKKEERPHEEMFWRLSKRTAIRVGDWKLLRNPRDGTGAEWQLYDLSKDTVEQTDLSQRQPEMKKQLLARWEQWNSEMIEPAWSRK